MGDCTKPLGAGHHPFCKVVSVVTRETKGVHCQGIEGSDTVWLVFGALCNKEVLAKHCC